MVNIKGTECKNWVADELPKIKQFLEKSSTPSYHDRTGTPNTEDIIISPATSNNHNQESEDLQDKGQLQVVEDVCPPDPVKDLEKDAITHQESTPAGENEELWKSMDLLKTAVSTIDKSLLDLSSRVNTSIESKDEQLACLGKKIDDLDKRLDEKVSVFFEAFEKSLLQKHNLLEKNFNNKIHKIREENTNLRNDMTNHMENLANNRKVSIPRESESEDENEVHTTKKEIEGNINELKINLTRISDDMQIEFASLSVVEKNISSLRKENEDIITQIHLLKQEYEKHSKQIMKNSTQCSNLGQATGNGPVSQNATKNVTAQVPYCCMCKTSLDTNTVSVSVQTAIDNFNRSTPHNPRQTVLNNLPQHHHTNATKEAAYSNESHEESTEMAALLSRDDASTRERIINPAQDKFANTAASETKHVPASASFVAPKTSTSSDERLVVDETMKLNFIIDLNVRYIDFRRLWTLKTTEVVRCGNMQDVYKYWSRNNKKYNDPKYSFMSVGTNDLVTRTPTNSSQISEI